MLNFSLRPGHTAAISTISLAVSGLIQNFIKYNLLRHYKKYYFCAYFRSISGTIF